MPGFNSYDDIIYKVSVLGKRLGWNFNKTGPTMQGVNGTWHTLAYGVGSPGAISDPAGTPGAVCDNLSGSMNWDAKNPDLKFLLSFGATSTQTCNLMLFDRLWGVGALSSASTGNKTVNSGALSRYGGASKNVSAATYPASPIQITTSASHGFFTGDVVTIASVGGNTNANGTWVVTYVDGTNFTLNGSTGNSAYTSGGTAIRVANDIQAWLEVTTASTTTQAVCSMNSYTNQAGVAGRAGGNLTWPAAATVVRAMLGPMPLQAGDTGVRSIEAGINFGTANTAGVFNAVLLKPLCYLPLIANQWNERDVMIQIPALPQIFDAASLGVMIQNTGTTAAVVTGEVRLAYG